MTSNQIALAQVRENERHDVASETELNRHNLATEQLANEANEIAAEKNAIDKEYKEKSLELDREIRAKELELNRTLGVKRVEIESKLADLQAKRDMVEKEYKETMAEVNKRETDNNIRAQDEVERHNVETEAINRSYNDRMLDLKDREIQYKEYESVQNVDINWMNARTQQSNMWSMNILREIQGANIRAKQPYEIGALQQQINVDNARWRWHGFDVLSNWIPKLNFKVGGK